ncbi:MAG: Uncharacterized protein LiPW15_181 [Parcubacteria group bacterium LiPW_15]|nr:MAG: Uncharacterized protein LiPW15_181 [Parcubacteria group bacterium LiPW_15]
MKKYLFLLLATLLIPNQVLGAAIRFQNSALGQVDVLLDTEGDAINVIDVSLRFDPKVFQIASLGDGNSAVNFWITKPGFSNDDGLVSFSGMIPGGMMGSAVKLINLNFSKAPASEGSFRVSGSAYLNDGSGRSISLAGDALVNPGSMPGANLSDEISPESFVPQLIQNDSLYDGKWALVFSTTDKGSGIARYELIENSLVLGGGRFSSSSAGSPYLLKDQKLASDIYVRAVDRAGNVREAILEAKNKPFWNWTNAAVLLVLLLLIVVAYVFLRRRYK